MTFIKIPVLIKLTIFLLSCSAISLAQQGNTSSKSQTGLLPLATGNKWTYVQIETNETLESRVEKSQAINGDVWYLYSEIGNRFWVRNEGLNQYEAIDFFEADSLQGDYIQAVKVINVDADSYYFEGIESASYKKCSVEITVPAGTFDCHIIKYDFGGGFFSESYYAEGIGLLKNIYRTEDGLSTVELKAYQLF